MSGTTRPSRFAPFLRLLFRSLSFALPASRLLAVDGVIPNLTYQPAEQFTAISPPGASTPRQAA